MGLDARQECVLDPGNEDMGAAFYKMKSLMPWMPMIANHTWLARTKADAAASIAEKKCSSRGIYSVQLPYEFYPKDGEVHNGVIIDGVVHHGVNVRQQPECRCFPGFTGPKCEVVMDQTKGLHKCLNDCSGRGTCEHNWCKCQEGTWGADCSLGAPPLPHPAAPQGLRPRIYVYDLEPRFTSWLGAFRKGDWTRDHWYAVDVILHAQLLRSPYRTLDPEQADYFFIPFHISLGYYSHRYYFKHFTEPARLPLKELLKYVRETWPYFKRKGGKDHIIVMTQDQGNRFVRQQVPDAENLIMIHHWGAPRSVIVDNGGQGDHRLGHDIVVPPFHGEQVKLNRWLPERVKGGDLRKNPMIQICVHRRRARLETEETSDESQRACEGPSLTSKELTRTPLDEDFKRDLFFSGKMNLNWGRAYALGVRQAVFRAHRNHSRFLIMTFDNGILEKIPLEQHVANYASSKFCLAPAGYGFSSRQYECILVGCVPIIIQDDVQMSFEEVLPWRRFSLRLNFSDIPILPQLLARVPAAHVARLRRGLGCIWPRMLWLAPGLYTGVPMLDSSSHIESARKEDAFETTMRTLRRRLPGVQDAAPWRAAGDSCVEIAGDDDELDLDDLRRQVRDAAPTLSADAAAMAEIISNWQRTGDDKEFAMRTRFFPSGIKIPGLKWT